MNRILVLILLSARILCSQPQQYSTYQETTAPTGNPTAGFAICWFDNVFHAYTCRNSSGAVISVSTNPCPTTGGASCLVKTDASGNVTITGSVTLSGAASGSYVKADGTGSGNPAGSGISACAATPPAVGAANSFCYDTSNNVWKCSNGSSACTTSGQWTAAGGSGTVTTSGSPTTNVVPKFTSATAIGNSALSDNGTTVTSTEPISAPSYTSPGNFNIGGIVSAYTSGVSGSQPVGATSPLAYFQTDTYDFNIYTHATGSWAWTTINSTTPACIFELVSTVTTLACRDSVANLGVPIAYQIAAVASTVTAGTGTVSFAGPTTARIWTGPDAAANLLTDHAAVTVAQGGTGLGTLTAHAVQVGEATSTPAQVGPNAATTYPLFSAGSSADPAFRAIAAGDLPVLHGQCTEAWGGSGA